MSQAQSVQRPASPDMPSPEDIAAAKSNESATAAEVTTIERILADAAEAQQATFALALQANNSYSDALVELQARQSAAAVATAKAKAAGLEQDRTRKQVGQLAGDLYRNGGMNPALSTFMSAGGEVLAQAATLEAISAGRSRAFQSAEAAAAAARSLTSAAEDANRAADDAARSAEARKTEAEQANAAQVKAVADAKAQRTVLVDQLAQLRNTTVALESARVDALDRQREEARLAAVTAAAASEGTPSNQAGSNQAGPAPVAGPAGGSPVPAVPAQGAPAPAPAPPSSAPAPVSAAPIAPVPAQVAPVPAPAPVAPSPSPAATNETAISAALAKVGAPYFYQWGGSGPYGFDCSGLVQAAFAAAGKYLPRTASQQYASAQVHVPLSQAQRGDLLVWGSEPNFYHVAIYLGNGQVVQALNPEQGIEVTPLSRMAGMQLYPYAARY